MSIVLSRRGSAAKRHLLTPLVYESQVKTQFGSGVNPWTIAAPPVINTGDLLIAIANTGTAGGFSATGWNPDIYASTSKVHVLTKVADGTEDGTTLSFDWANGTHSGSLIVIRVSGPANPIIEASSFGSGFGSGNVTAPGVTTLGPDRLLIAYYTAENTGVLRSWSVPSGMAAKYVESSTGWQCATFSELIAAAGATGNRVSSMSGSSATWDAILLAIGRNG